MNCEEYKELIAAEPSEPFAGGAEHVAACDSCRAFKADIVAQNELIAKAFAIDVPPLRMPELPAIGAANENVVNLPFKSQARSKMPAWIGIAASLALAAIIGVQFVGSERSGSALPTAGDQQLAAQVLEHLDHEPYALKVTDVSVSDERLARVVNPTVGTMDGNVGLVSYAQSCIINGNTIPHLVIQGENGPVTLLLMPEEMVSSAVPLTGEGVEGAIFPVGDGSIAIIGERGERLEELKQKVVDSVEWSI